MKSSSRIETVGSNLKRVESGMAGLPQHSRGAVSGPPIEDANKPGGYKEFVHSMLETASEMIDECSNFNSLA